MFHEEATPCVVVPLSGCSVHMIPGIDFRNLFFFFSLSPVLHLISYFDGLSFYWNQSSLRSYWDRSCLDLQVGSLNLSLDFHWDQNSLNLSLGFHWDKGNPSEGGSLAFSLLSLEPQVRGQSRRTGGSWRFHAQIYTLRTLSPACLTERKMATHIYFYPFPLFSTEPV